MQFRIMRFLKSGMVALLVALAVPAGVSFADPLDDARASGQIGERPDGYVAAVQSNPSPQVQQLVTDINAQRRKVYEQLAGQKGVPVDEVAALAAEKTISQKLKPGMYYMNNAGQWVQK